MSNEIPTLTFQPFDAVDEAQEIKEEIIINNEGYAMYSLSQ